MNAKSFSVYLGLGSNIGDLRQNLNKALYFIGQRLQIEKTSSVYDTTPECNPNQPNFLNLVVQASTTLEPMALLSLIKGFEAKLGRVPSQRYNPRTMDIDILSYGQYIINSPELTIPHPHMHERAFVLVPLVEIAPDFIHPVTGKTASQMLSELKKGVQGVLKLLDPLKRGADECTE
ncbi:MAG: 2-amino-4-hydroxy-6-hydroxymethyldihydropteridine diphosphokinase [Dehalococcoidia bacterium]|nr:2-amino-4-hydroxy-6-hydroxymethyldihydropteridine diphosphokinase [Dehalococcoidia bacterium]